MNTFLGTTNSLHETLAKIGALKFQISACRRHTRKLKTLRRDVRRLAGDRLFSLAVELRPLYERVEQKAAEGEVYLSKQEAQAMIESCDQLRLRMLAVAMGAEPHTFFAEAAATAHSEGGAIVRLSSDLIYTRFGQDLIILLPDLDSHQACEQILADLLLIYDSPHGQRSNWILDFSSVTHRHSTLFPGILEPLKHDLEKNGLTLGITWLRPSLYPTRLVKKLRAAFNLTLVGGFLFSQTRNCTNRHALGDNCIQTLTIS